ncbi:MAG: hypothetical protein KAQ62_28535, partial [Cyclobacteriaceae bacterium]|nr:hypothetical protein [Cyclobacteriaceae bacterium]
MKSKNITTVLATILLFSLAFDYSNLCAQTKSVYQLENPMSVQYLKKNLRKSQPRLVLNATIEKKLRRKLKTDPLIQNIYESIKYNVETVLERDLITLDITDNPNSQRNQLGISRDFLY